MSDEDAIRKDERRRLAELLRSHAAVIGEFAGDTEATVRLIAFLIALDHDEAEGVVDTGEAQKCE